MGEVRFVEGCSITLNPGSDVTQVGIAGRTPDDEDILLPVAGRKLRAKSSTRASRGGAWLQSGRNRPLNLAAKVPQGSRSYQSQSET
jgi:hypothetical protein